MGIFMKYCIRCGRALHDNDRICGGCGMNQPFVPPQQFYNRPSVNRPPVYHPPVRNVPCYALVPVYHPPVPRHKKGVIPLLVWSLILVPFFNIIGTPLAVVAAMLCLSADADQNENTDRKLYTAATLCIIATIVDLVTIIWLVASTLYVLRG
jgi:hypothetical protein